MKTLFTIAIVCMMSANSVFAQQKNKPDRKQTAGKNDVYREKEKNALPEPIPTIPKMVDGKVVAPIPGISKAQDDVSARPIKGLTREEFELQNHQK